MLTLSIGAVEAAVAGNSVKEGTHKQVSTLTEALRQGTPTLNFRYRFENVDQNGIANDANASTLRTRLSYQTLPFQGFSGLVEMDNVTEIHSGDYNDTFNGQTSSPVVADPTYTEVNQAYLDFNTTDTLFRFGRQRVNLDNQRFIGGVGWRQNEQTYDAFSIINQTIPDTTVLISNVTNVNTILGTNVNGNDHQLIHINNKSLPALNISAYGYLLNDFSDTYGIRMSNGKAGTLGGLLYTLEYAHQKADSPVANKAEYMLMEAGINLSGITAKLSYEVLGSDSSNYGFQTPLATKHAFSGWADKFLTTPDSGLVDRYLTLSTAQFGPQLKLVYHDFESDDTGTDLGDEIDFSIGKKIDDNYSMLLKFARYRAGDDNSIKDTDKLWFMMGASF
ncbi:hypothetical protein BGP75_16900 [Motiliproteus sp. MSK22-1]|nr:hypothetical protein BGP75_16900 [Motiliproteus sp. MSK22-1]